MQSDIMPAVPKPTPPPESAAEPAVRPAPETFITAPPPAPATPLTPPEDQNTLATPPPEEAAPTNQVTVAPVSQADPVAVPKIAKPRTPGVGLAVTATTIIIVVLAGLAVLAYFKQHA